MSISKVNLINNSVEITNAYTAAALANLGQRFSQDADNLLIDSVTFKDIFSTSKTTYRNCTSSNTAGTDSLYNIVWHTTDENGNIQTYHKPVYNLSHINNPSSLNKAVLSTDSKGMQYLDGDVIQIDILVTGYSNGKINYNLLPGVKYTTSTNNTSETNTDVFNSGNYNGYENFKVIIKDFFDEIVSSCVNTKIWNNQGSSLDYDYFSKHIIQVFFPADLKIKYIYNSVKILYNASDITTKYWRAKNTEDFNRPKISGTDNFILVSTPITIDNELYSFSNTSLAPNMSCIKNYTFNAVSGDVNNTEYTVVPVFTSPYVDEYGKWVINGTSTEIKATENYSGSLVVTCTDMTEALTKVGQENFTTIFNPAKVKFSIATNENHLNEKVEASLLYNERLWKTNGEYNITTVVSTPASIIQNTGFTGQFKTVYPKYTADSNIGDLSINVLAQLRGTVIMNITRWREYSSTSYQDYNITTFWTFKQINTDGEWEFIPLLDPSSGTAYDLNSLLNVDYISKLLVKEIRESDTDENYLFDQIVFKSPFKNDIKNQDGSINGINTYPLLKSVYDTKDKQLFSYSESNSIIGLAVGFINNSTVASNNNVYNDPNFATKESSLEVFNPLYEGKVVLVGNVLKDNKSSFNSIKQISKSTNSTEIEHTVSDRILGGIKDVNTEISGVPYFDMSQVFVKDINTINRYNIISVGEDTIDNPNVRNLYHAYLGVKPAIVDNAISSEADLKYNDDTFVIGTSVINNNIGTGVLPTKYLNNFKEYKTLLLDFEDIRLRGSHVSLQSIINDLEKDSFIVNTTNNIAPEKNAVSSETLTITPVIYHKKSQVARGTEQITPDYTYNLTYCSKDKFSEEDIWISTTQDVIAGNNNSDIIKQFKTTAGIINYEINTTTQPVIRVGLRKLLASCGITKKIFTMYNDVVNDINKDKSIDEINLYPIWESITDPKYAELVSTNFDLYTINQNSGKTYHPFGSIGVFFNKEFSSDSTIKDNLKSIGNTIEQSFIEFDPEDIKINVFKNVKLNDQLTEDIYEYMLPELVINYTIDIASDTPRLVIDIESHTWKI